ncbi:MAG TPA: hypothetical protein PLE77_09090 [Kiritimatiellia bacterium]|nr:hypothetical protein [Kiritimatiellia bacterium]
MPKDDKLSQLVALGLAAGISGSQQKTREELEHLKRALSRQSEEAEEDRRRAEEQARRAEDQAAQEQWHRQTLLDAPELLFRLQRALPYQQSESESLIRDLEGADEKNADDLQARLGDLRSFVESVRSIESRFLTDWTHKTELEKLAKATRRMVFTIDEHLDRLARLLAEREALNRCSVVVPFLPSDVSEFRADSARYADIEKDLGPTPRECGGWDSEKDEMAMIIGIVVGVLTMVVAFVRGIDDSIQPLFPSMDPSSRSVVNQMLVFGIPVAVAAAICAPNWLAWLRWRMRLSERTRLETKWGSSRPIQDHRKLLSLIDNAVRWDGDVWAVKEEFVQRVQRDIKRRLL